METLTVDYIVLWVHHNFTVPQVLPVILTILSTSHNYFSIFDFSPYDGLA